MPANFWLAAHWSTRFQRALERRGQKGTQLRCAASFMCVQIDSASELLRFVECACVFCFSLTEPHGTQPGNRILSFQNEHGETQANGRPFLGGAPKFLRVATPATPPPPKKKKPKRAASTWTHTKQRPSLLFDFFLLQTEETKVADVVVVVVNYRGVT